MAVTVEIKVEVVVVVLVATEKLNRKRPERYRLASPLVSLFSTDGSAERKKLVDEMEGWMKLVFNRSSK